MYAVTSSNYIPLRKVGGVQLGNHATVVPHSSEQASVLTFLHSVVSVEDIV